MVLLILLLLILPAVGEEIQLPFYASSVRGEIYLYKDAELQRIHTPEICYDHSWRLKVIRAESNSYYIRDEDGNRGWIAQDWVAKCEGKTYDFGEPIPWEVPVPFDSTYSESHYPEETDTTLPDDMRELITELKELERITDSAATAKREGSTM